MSLSYGDVNVELSITRMLIDVNICSRGILYIIPKLNDATFIVFVYASIAGAHVLTIVPHKHNATLVGRCQTSDRTI